MRKNGKILRRVSAAVLAFLMVLGSIPFSSGVLTAEAAESTSGWAEITVPLYNSDANECAIKMNATTTEDTYLATMEIPSRAAATRMYVDVVNDGKMISIKGEGHAIPGFGDKKIDEEYKVPSLSSFGIPEDTSVDRIWNSFKTLICVRNLFTDLDSTQETQPDIWSVKDNTITVNVQESKSVDVDNYSIGDVVGEPVTGIFNLTKSNSSDGKTTTFTVEADKSDENKASYKELKELAKKYGEKSSGSGNLDAVKAWAKDDDTLLISAPKGTGRELFGYEGMLTANALIEIQNLAGQASRIASNLNTVNETGVRSGDNLITLTHTAALLGYVTQPITVNVTFEASPVAKVYAPDEFIGEYYTMDEAVEAAKTTIESTGEIKDSDIRYLSLLEKNDVTAELGENDILIVGKEKLGKIDVTGAEAYAETDEYYIYGGKLENVIAAAPWISENDTLSIQVTLCKDAEVEVDSLNYEPVTLDLASYTLSTSAEDGTDLSGLGGLVASDGGKLGSGTFTFGINVDGTERDVTFTNGTGTTPALDSDPEGVKYWAYDKKDGDYLNGTLTPVMAEFTVVFHDIDKKECARLTVGYGVEPDEASIPAGPVVSGKKFEGWADEDGNMIGSYATLSNTDGAEVKVYALYADKLSATVKANDDVQYYTGKEVSYDLSKITVIPEDALSADDFTVTYDKTPVETGDYTVTISWDENEDYLGGSVTAKLTVQNAFAYDYIMNPGQTEAPKAYYEESPVTLELTQEYVDEGVYILSVTSEGKDISELITDAKTAIEFDKTYYDVEVTFAKDVTGSDDDQETTTSLSEEDKSSENETVSEEDKSSENEAASEEDKSSENEAVVGTDEASKNEAVTEEDKTAENETTFEEDKITENETTLETEPTDENKAVTEEDKTVEDAKDPETDAVVDSTPTDADEAVENTDDPEAEKARALAPAKILASSKVMVSALNEDGTTTLTVPENIGNIIIETKPLTFADESGVTVSGNKGTVSAVVPETDNGIVSITYTYNNTTVIRTGDELATPLSIVGDGKYNVTVTAVDKIGRTVTTSYEVVIDSTKPVINVAVSGTDSKTISVQVTDNLTAVSGTYKLVNTSTNSVKEGTIGADGKAVITVSEIGKYTLTVTATDEKGNTATATKEFEIAKPATPDKPTTPTEPTIPSEPSKPSSSGNKHHHSSGSSEPNYTYTGMVLKDEASGILASGISVKSTSVLKVTDIPKTSFTSAAVQGSSFYKGYEVAIDGGFYETLKIHFPIGQAKNGQTATILQEKADGSVQAYTVTIADGYATIDVTELGRFAISLGSSNVIAVTPAGAADPNATSPKTGDPVVDGGAATGDSDTAEAVPGVVGTVSIAPENAPNFALYGGILVVLLLATAMVYYFVMKKSEFDDEE